MCVGTATSPGIMASYFLAAWLFEGGGVNRMLLAVRRGRLLSAPFLRASCLARKRKRKRKSPCRAYNGEKGQIKYESRRHVGVPLMRLSPRCGRLAASDSGTAAAKEKKTLLNVAMYDRSLRGASAKPLYIKRALLAILI